MDFIVGVDMMIPGAFMVFGVMRMNGFLNNSPFLGGM
jgi:hypothetical protein